MATRRDRHQARKAAVSALGRELSRRARSRCELCAASTALSVIEVDGNPHDDPDVDWAVLICSGCADHLQGAALASARHLAESAWSEVRPAQISAVRLLRRARDEGIVWAGDTLDTLYLDEKVEELL